MYFSDDPESAVIGESVRSQEEPAAGHAELAVRLDVEVSIVPQGIPGRDGEMSAAVRLAIGGGMTHLRTSDAQLKHRMS